MNTLFINPGIDQWPALLQRPKFDTVALETAVAQILEEVKLNGNNGVIKYNKKFDGVSIVHLQVSESEINEAVNVVEDDIKEAIKMAMENIYTFHKSQQEPIIKIETTTGVTCWRKSVAIEKVGLYIPGGTAPLFSTLLMLGIPALIAGCSEIVVCTPADKNGNVNPVILFTAHLLGLKNVFKIGGVQAIAAMAYGTESVPKVYKIFGPGNQYVTCAKQFIQRDGTAIDMPAGPSEVAVFADNTAIPAYVAADLLSQAEHGVDSQVVLVCSSEQMIIQINQEINKQLKDLPRKDIAKKALQNSKFIVMKDIDNAFDFLNEYAPEHLIIASDVANNLAEKVVNAGSVFLGHFSPESAGDYASGTNHTLPTNGYAKTYSGVSLDSFIKKITFQNITHAGLEALGKTVETMAAAEGLEAHKQAVSIRLKDISK